jgi:hypothetical protein
MATNRHALDIDPGVDDRRDSIEVYRYRVRHDQDWVTGVEIRGRTYRRGEEVLLSGVDAFSVPGRRLELVSPEPVKQEEDPATWQAQYASSVHVHLGPGVVINKDGCRVKAEYAGDQGTARVHVVFDAVHWGVCGSLTLEDVERLRAELGQAIAEMRDKMYREMDVDEDGTNHGGDLLLHQIGGSW